MCGIAGVISQDKRFSEEECIRFINSLAHRGPDGRGVFFDCHSNLFLGHRRLKILDLTDAGKQPMFSQDGRYAIVFNGEIYNFLELREGLSKKGYSFVSDSDTEVILAAYAEWKEDCQFKFNGMWAFAIWDVREKSLFLSRDRFGVKPLYFRLKQRTFEFASEIKAFHELSFNEQSIADAIEDPLGIEPTSGTLFHDVQKVPAGCCLSYSFEGILKLRRWWNTLSHLVDVPDSMESQAERFRHLFFDACSIRMRSDVPIGTALSGGLDSSSILCSISSMNKTSHQRWPDLWQKSFTAVFPNSAHEELEYAKLVVNHTNADARFISIQSSDFIEHFEDCLYSTEDIFDPPIGPWLLYRAYRKEGTVISIDGHGADELLCGYPHQFERALLETIFPFPNWVKFRRLWPLMKQMHPEKEHGSKLVFKLLKQTCQSAFFDQKSAAYQFIKNLYWGRFSNQAGFGRYGWLQIKPKVHASATNELGVSREFKRLSLLNQGLYLDFHFRTLPSILRNFDRCSMAHGIEIRAPFMDWRIVTQAFSLPTQSKAGELGSKHLLRLAMKGILPEEIRLRKSKIGFASPLAQWIAGDLKHYIMESVLSRSFQASSIWNGPKIARDAERFMQERDFTGLRRVWEFVIADRLMHVFKTNSRDKSLV